MFTPPPRKTKWSPLLTDIAKFDVRPDGSSAWVRYGFKNASELAGAAAAVAKYSSTVMKNAKKKIEKQKSSDGGFFLFVRVAKLK